MSISLNGFVERYQMYHHSPLSDFSAVGTAVLQKAQRHANELRHNSITTAHVVAGLMHGGPMTSVLNEQFQLDLRVVLVGVGRLDIKKPDNERFVFADGDSFALKRYTLTLNQALNKAVRIAKKSGRVGGLVIPEDILRAILAVYDEDTQDLFKVLALDKDAIKQHLKAARKAAKKADKLARVA